MDDSKTVRSDNQILDPIYEKQKEDVANMRASLLSCMGEGRISSAQALRNITVMRVYHQLSRIIRYTEMMDKLEAKLYDSIENTIENMDADKMSTWMTLLQIQEKLQKSMIESHKLLQPYLDMEQFTFVNQPAVIDEPEKSYGSLVLEQESRDKLRESAQAVLAAIESQKGDSDE